MNEGRIFSRAIEPKRSRGQAMLEYSLLCAVLLLALVAPWSGNPSPAQQLLDAPTPPLLIDVREQNEWDAGYLHGATHAPQGTISFTIANIAPEKSAPILLYCAGGVRSAAAAETLAGLGYTNLRSMAGGINGWSAAGLPVVETTTLTPEQKSRYSRHLLLPGVGADGQTKLLNARVLMVGAGGLGAPAALYLAAAGVGKLRIIDFDSVEASNLQRQVIHGTSWVGKPKIESAKARILEINPHCQVDLYETALTSENALEIIRPYDIVCDGTDNFPTRYLVNDACVLLGKPNVYGSIFRFEGQATVFNLDAESPNYRDLFPEPPPPGMVPSCAEGGVVDVLPGIIGVIQATEAVKIITGIGTTLSGRLLLFDALAMKFRELKLRPNPERPVIDKLIDYQEFCGVGGSAPGQEEAGAVESISVSELKVLLDGDTSGLVLIDVRNPPEAEIGVIPGAELIPLDQIENGTAVERIQQLAAGKTLYVHCKLGGRSAKALIALKRHGIEGINVAGGIDAWSQEVDPSVPRY